MTCSTSSLLNPPGELSLLKCGAGQSSNNIATMDLEEIDIHELRQCMLLALDFLVAHRVARDHSYDLARVTAARDALEERVLLALVETDIAEMPDGWSWKQAAHEISIRVALDIVEERNTGRGHAPSRPPVG